MFGVCNMSIVPARKEASHRSEMVTQLLLGETFRIIEEQEDWVKIETSFDTYECWISNKQFNYIREEDVLGSASSTNLVSDLVSVVHQKETNTNVAIVAGTVLPKFGNGNFKIANTEFSFEGKPLIFPKQKIDVKDLTQTALNYLNAPYLWGGRSIFGIDCSGFTQMVFKLNGFQLPRDAYQQAEIGDSLNFVEEAQAGDLAFFDNEEGRIIHVGLILDNQQIIHAHGCVRIDKYDHYGIFHSERKKYSHMLRVIKRVI